MSLLSIGYRGMDFEHSDFSFWTSVTSSFFIFLCSFGVWNQCDLNSDVEFYELITFEIQYRNHSIEFRETLISLKTWFSILCTTHISLSNSIEYVRWKNNTFSRHSALINASLNKWIWLYSDFEPQSSSLFATSREILTLKSHVKQQNQMIIIYCFKLFNIFEIENVYVFAERDLKTSFLLLGIRFSLLGKKSLFLHDFEDFWGENHSEFRRIFAQK